MAAKLLHSLADDNPDLQKQIGCMTGIFQIFENRRLSHRRLLPPPGNSQFSNESLDVDSSNAYLRDTVESNPNKYVNDKQRASTESSTASFSSSSRSSSFSSLDCVRTGQPDPSALDRIIFPETPSKDPVITQTSASPKMGNLSIDLRDVVKDSIYRDSRGLSVNMINKNEGSGHPMKDKVSPRPLQLSKSVDGLLGGVKNGKHDLPADLESLRVLAKLREAPWYYNEKEPLHVSYETKDGSSLSAPRDARRHSYDGRETNLKIKDLPRFSLDSRESSAWAFSFDSKLSYLSQNIQKENDSDRVSRLQQPSVHSRTSVVAKLMGLEMLHDKNNPNENQPCSSKAYSLKDHKPLLVPLRTSGVCRPVRLPNSPRSPRKELTSPRWRNADGIMKPVSSSKFPIEPAPWKHLDGARDSQKRVSRQVKSSASSPSTSMSVYGEIEKRLKDLEFKQSGKDLRALKQILEAMQAKGFLEASKEQCLNGRTMEDLEKRYKGSNLSANLTSPNDPRSTCASASKYRGSSSKTLESPIVIMKPARLLHKSGYSSSSIIPIDGLSGLQRPNSGDVAGNLRNTEGSQSGKVRIHRDHHKDSVLTSNDRKTNGKNSEQTLTNPQQVVKDTSTTSSKTSGSITPRLQRKKLEYDKRSRPPTPPTDSGKARRQSNRASTDAGSPGGRRRPKTKILQQSDDQSSERSSDSRNLSFIGDDIAVQSDINVTDEVTSSGHPELTECRTLSSETLICSISEETEKVHVLANGSLRPSGHDMVEECAIFAPEQPSPVSVFDASAYREDSPSPVKQMSHALQDNGTTDTNENAVEEQQDPEGNLPTTGSELPSEINWKKLKNIENLVQKLRRLNSSHDEAQTDYIASLCENPDPDHRYVSEILLASGLLLRDLGSSLDAFQLHPSGHPINPELFFVLEQTKASNCLSKGHPISHSGSDSEKLHRKLVFDAVNEILGRRLESIPRAVEPWFKPDKLARKTLNAQQLLRDLCAEIEEIQANGKPCNGPDEREDDLKSILCEDVMRRSKKWTDFQGDVSGIVLDVERSIFKDLVDDIVRGEASAGFWKKPNRHCKQLFSK